MVRLQKLTVYLTLTSVVFELEVVEPPVVQQKDLTLTSVVFECSSCRKLGLWWWNLTLTSVVFEYE